MNEIFSFYFIVYKSLIINYVSVYLQHQIIGVRIMLQDKNSQEFDNKLQKHDLHTIHKLLFLQDRCSFNYLGIFNFNFLKMN